jgi:hypothetical protein
MERKYPLLVQHYLAVIENCSQGRTEYSEEMKTFYAFAGYCRENFSTILLELLGFPSYRTSLRYGHDIADELEINTESFELRPEKVAQMQGDSSLRVKISEQLFLQLTQFHYPVLFELARMGQEKDYASLIM